MNEQKYNNIPICINHKNIEIPEKIKSNLKKIKFTNLNILLFKTFIQAEYFLETSNLMQLENEK